jgi:aspartate kinase
MLKVLKFGGTSVGTLDKIQNVANIIKEIKDQGHDIIAVVSAMSGETNKLMEYSSYFTTQPKKNELDVLLSSGERITSSLLSIALNTQGYQTISMSGRQAGIFTNENHTRARIDNIDIKNIKKEIDNNNIIIVAGFQGITKNGRVSTLGRGGSDLSAVAIAGAIKADICEIYTDVDGIYTTDPRIEPKAKKLDKISYDEMLELSSLGAKVLQNRSVELAKKLNVNLVSRSSFDTKISGTLITKEENIMEKPLVSGIALDRNQVRVGMYGVIDKPGIAASIFSALANEDINVDMIVQTVGVNNITDLDFTVPRTQLEITKKIMEEFKSYTKNIDYNEEVSKVSIVGVGMKSHVGIASKAFQALANENINIRIISTSEIKISMIILEKYSELAVRALHEVYNLDR